MNLIETPKITIYNTKHNQHIKVRFQILIFLSEIYILKNGHSVLSAFSPYFHGPPLADLKIEYIYIYICVYMYRLRHNSTRRFNSIRRSISILTIKFNSAMQFNSQGGMWKPAAHRHNSWRIEFNRRIELNRQIELHLFLNIYIYICTCI